MIRWLIAAATSVVILAGLFYLMSLAARYFFPSDNYDGATSLAADRAASRMQSAPEAARPALSADQCLTLEADINNEIVRAGLCESDADCAFEGFGCPFGCADAVNPSRTGLVKTKVLEYREQCFACEYRCAAPGLDHIPKCVKNQCITFEKTIEMLQDETKRRITSHRDP